MSVRGVDTIDRTLTGTMIMAAGYSFACRYILNAPGSDLDKETSFAELQEKSKADCRVVANFEWGEEPDDTISKGQEHAGHFLQWVEDNPGVPTWAPCYFSLDANNPAGSYHSYFVGVLRELGGDLSRSAVYGNGACARSLLKADLASMWWQSKSLSYAGNYTLTTGGTRVWNHTDATMYQQVATVSIGGHSCDVNVTQADYYGGFLLGEEDPTMAFTLDEIATAVVNKLKADASDLDLKWRVHAIANALDTYAAGSMKGDPVGLTRLLRAIPTVPAATPAAIAAAVVAELSPSQAGGVTAAQVEQAVAKVLTGGTDSIGQ